MSPLVQCTPMHVHARPTAERRRFDGCEAVSLSAGELEATFVPERGMVGVSLRHGGDDLIDRQGGLRAYSDRGAVMGIPFLHPWANRLAGFSYSLHGRDVRLQSDPPLVHCDEHGLPIHGLLAASRYWEVVALDADGDRARLHAALDFGAHAELMAAFPFRHEVMLEAALTTGRLTITTRIRATGGAPVPISFGFHPYLRLPGSDRAGWQVALPARRHLRLDDRGVPTGETEDRPPTEFELADRHFDDGYDRLPDGAAFSVSDGDWRIAVTFERGYPVGQVFAPAGSQFICFEPMTAPTNALRSGVGLRRVMPGREFTAVFSIAVSGGFIRKG
jgi:galactose mutarotase-like enzyme